MTQIALNVETTHVPDQWAYLPVRHFDWAGTNDTSGCEGCGVAINTHLWRVRTADGRVLDCGLANT